MTTPTNSDDGNAMKRADLVLEGGGVKGIGLAGAVTQLAASGYTFERVAGTSAGAIAAALIAALNVKKRPMSDLSDILKTVDYQKFMGSNKLVAAEHLLIRMGLYNGKYLKEWLGDALTQIGITKFGELRWVDAGADRTLTDAQRYTLVVHTSDITRGRLVRLPWDYPAYGEPDIDELPIVDAVRASMSIPFFFEPVKFRAPDATLDGVTYQGGEVTWVDGGMLSNFPVEVFDRGDGVASRWDTIGIKLSARETVVTSSASVTNVAAEAIACLHTLLDNADRYYLTPDKAARTIFVDNAGLKATDFHLTTADQQKLYTNGATAAKSWTQPAGAASVSVRSSSSGASS